jgi:hypothetical protein
MTCSSPADEGLQYKAKARARKSPVDCGDTGQGAEFLWKWPPLDKIIFLDYPQTTVSGERESSGERHCRIRWSLPQALFHPTLPRKSLCILRNWVQ